MKNKKEEMKNSSFWTFPEKLNGTSLFIILLLSTVVVFCISVLLFINKTKPYVPNYEELIYSEDVNSSFAVCSSYTYNENVLKKQNRITMYLSKIKRNDTSHDIGNIKASMIGQYKDGTIEYLSEYSSDSNLSNNYARTHQFTCLTASSSEDYETLYGKFTYDYIEGSDRTNKMFTLKETKLSLTEEEIKKEYGNEIIESGIFSKHSVKKEEGTEAEMFKISTNFSLNSAKTVKYHLDYQLFGVDSSNEVYDLIGIYNSSSEVNSDYSRSVSFPNNYALSYLIVKLNYTDETGVKTTLYSKIVY